MNNLRIMTPMELHESAPAVYGRMPCETRSDRYVFIDTSIIVDKMAQHGFFPTDAKQGRTRKAGRAYYTKHVVKFSRPGNYFSVHGDEVLPEIAVLNAHDGSGSFKIMAGLLRVACLNGLLVADNVIGSISVHHSGNILDDVIEGVYKIIDCTGKAIDNSLGMSLTRMTEIESFAFAEAASRLRWDKDKTTVHHDCMLERLREEDNYGDLWTVFNVIQEKLVRGGMPTNSITPKGMRVLKARELRSVTENIRINTQLWDMANGIMQAKHKGIPADEYLYQREAA